METSETKNFIKILQSIMLQTVPSYANKFFYSLGFLSMTALLILILSGIVMVFNGPTWWLVDSFGVYVRSIHLWATQAFVFFIFLHLLRVFLTSAFRLNRKLTWVFGALMFTFAMFEAELGYGLRGDFSSQWRALQASDLYNGSGLGLFINNLNYAQVYGIHIIIIPAIIVSLLFVHYFLVRVMGVAKPFKKDVFYKMVKANHNILFLRGFVLVGVIVVLAFLFRSPLILLTTIKDVVSKDPNLMIDTLFKELEHTSDTATYLDNINPYKYDTAKIYIQNPYQQYISRNKQEDMYLLFNIETKDLQTKNIKLAKDYFTNKGAINSEINLNNPLITVISSLVLMGQNGDYENYLNSSANVLNKTYATRFLSDTGVLEEKANSLNITTDQYGMVREENDGIFPPGAWWLLPIGILDHTILANDPNQDRDGAEILALSLFLLIAFPYIPYLNRIPEKLNIDKWLWKDKK